MSAPVQAHYGIYRTLITGVSRKQSMKEPSYRTRRRFSERCGIEASDVMVSIITPDKADWSSSLDGAQFLTGEL